MIEIEMDKKIENREIEGFNTFGKVIPRINSRFWRGSNFSSHLLQLNSMKNHLSQSTTAT